MVEGDDTCHNESTQETEDYSEGDDYDFLQGLPKEQQVCSFLLIGFVSFFM